MILIHITTEITAFLKVVHSAAPDPGALMKLYTREGARLNGRLMLMQRITRREFLRHRLESLATTSSSSSPSMPKGDQDEVPRLREDLKLVSDILRRDLPDYEREYPSSLAPDVFRLLCSLVLFVVIVVVHSFTCIDTVRGSCTVEFTMRTTWPWISNFILFFVFVIVLYFYKGH